MVTSAEDDQGGDRPSMGFFLDNRWARAGLSGALAVLVVTVVAWNLPRSVAGYEIRDDVQAELAPVVYRLAMDQGWEVFAPNPSSISTAIDAEVLLEDGTVIAYRFPDDGPGIGALREYRWRKWETRIRKESNDHLWPGTADWIAAQYGGRGNPVVEVTLVRHFSRTPEPGSGDRREWESVEFYTRRYGPEVER